MCGFLILRSYFENTVWRHEEKNHKKVIQKIKKIIGKISIFLS